MWFNIQRFWIRIMYITASKCNTITLGVFCFSKNRSKTVYGSILNLFHLLLKIVYNSNVPQEAYTIIQTGVLIPLNVCKRLHSPQMFIVQLYNFMPQAYQSHFNDQWWDINKLAFRYRLSKYRSLRRLCDFRRHLRMYDSV